MEIGQQKIIFQYSTVYNSEVYKVYRLTHA